MVQYDSVKVKDQLDRAQDTAIQIKRFTDTIVIEDTPTVISTETIGDSWIWDSASNGEWGDDEWGYSLSFVLSSSVAGLLGSATLGETGRLTTLQVVTSPNKVFKEYFGDNYFEDTGVTTADWASVSGQLDFTTGEIAQSNEVAYNDGTISKATITVTVSSGVVTNLAFQLTADGGSNWESVTHATEHAFTNTGTDLRFKITASGTVTVTEIRVSYSS